MLLWLNTGRACYLFTKTNKAPNLIAKFGECLIICRKHRRICVHPLPLYGPMQQNSTSSGSTLNAHSVDIFGFPAYAQTRGEPVGPVCCLWSGLGYCNHRIAEPNWIFNNPCGIDRAREKSFLHNAHCAKTTFLNWRPEIFLDQSITV